MSLFDNDTAASDVIAYRPERAGEAVEGVVISIDSTSSEFTSDPIPVINVRTEDGTVRGIRAYHGVLRSRLQEKGVRVGDTLGVKFNGKKPTKDGRRTYWDYTVVVQHDAGAGIDLSTLPF